MKLIFPDCSDWSRVVWTFFSPLKQHIDRLKLIFNKVALPERPEVKWLDRRWLAVL